MKYKIVKVDLENRKVTLEPEPIEVEVAVMEWAPAIWAGTEGAVLDEKQLHEMGAFKKFIFDFVDCGIKPGKYNCISSFMSYPWILKAKNYNDVIKSEEDLINFLQNEERYIMEVL